MNIAVTGALGFIGTNLCRYLEQENTVSRYDLYYQDEQFKPDECDILIHLAATNSITKCNENPELVLFNNIDYFRLQFEKFSKAKMIVYASSSSVYARSNHFSDYVDIVPPTTMYGISKHCNEYMAHIMANAFKVKAVGLRFFNIFGPHQGFRGEYTAFVPKVMDAILRGGTIQLYNQGNNRRDFTPITYLCYLIEKLINNRDRIPSNHTVLNLGATESMKTELMYKALVTEFKLRGIENKSRVELCPKREWEIEETRANMESWIQLGLASEQELDEVYMYPELKRTVDWFLKDYIGNKMG